MKQTLIYKVVDVKDEMPSLNITVRTSKEFCLCYIDGAGNWYGVFNEGVVSIDAPQYWLKPTTYIEIEGALYESIEHYEKVHGESFEAGEKRQSIVSAYYLTDSVSTAELNEAINKSDFLKEKTK